MSGTQAQHGLAATLEPADVAQRCLRRRAVVAISVVLLTFAAFWPTAASLMARWEDTVGRTYTHGYVVLVLSLWMIWRNRARWAAGAAAPFLPAAGVLVVGALLWLVAYRAGLQIVHQAALPALAAAALCTVFGWRMTRALAFPLLWLYLAIPVWDALLPLLNWISVMAVRMLLRIADVPAYFVNNTFQIPSGIFAIADGCSGLHFFVVGLTVALLYGELNRDTPRMRAWLVAFALVLAMATNWLRIFIIVLAGHFTEMQHPLVTQEHYSFGWYMFAGMMVLYFLIVRRWPEAPATSASPPAATGVVAPTRALVAALLALAVAPAWLLIDTNRASEAQLSQAMLEDAVPRPTPGAAGDWRPNFPGASRELHGSFVEEGTTVEFHAAGYLAQHQGAELVGFGNSLLGEKLRRGPRGTAPAPWKEQLADGAGGRSVIWSAYRLDDRWYSSSLRVQLDYGLRSLWSAPAGAVIALRAPCTATSCDSARQTL